MLTIDRIERLDGTISRGFFVRNRKGKVLALGCFAGDKIAGDAFVIPAAKKHAKDVSLCQALLKLTGCPVKWPLVLHGRAFSTNTRQHLERAVRNLHLNKQPWGHGWHCVR